MRVMGEFAFDATVRSMDTDGRMHIAKSHISKACVNPYYGSEIPGHQALGLDTFRVYYMLRDPVELARAASTFARLPILSQHKATSASDHQTELVVGAIGSDVEFNDPYLDADVCIWENGAIAGIETDMVREFSCAYRYTPDMTPGEYHGQRYDGVMREIHGNHLALVETGRAGSDVLAADEAIKTMKTTKLGNALVITLGGMSPKLAQDSLLALVGQASKNTFNAAEVSTKLIAMDADLDPTKLKAIFEGFALDGGPDMGPRTEVDPAEDKDDDEDDEDDEKKKKMAKDAEEDKEKDKKAMDAALDSRVASIRRDLMEADQARRDVREAVGDVVAQDSAEAIYGFALDHMKVDHKDVIGVPSLKALYTVAKNARSAAPAPVAMDAAGLASRFPNATRFRQA